MAVLTAASALALAPATEARWAPPATLTGPVETVDGGPYWQVGVDARGRITSAWWDDGRLYVRTVAPAGQPVTEEVAVPPGRWGSDLAVATTGEAMITLSNGSEVMVALRDHGDFFGSPVRVSSGEGEPDWVYGRIGRHGEAVVTWQRVARGRLVIEVARRAPREEFRTPEVVVGPPRAPWGPELDMDADGNALLSWSEPVGTLDSRIWVARGSGRRRFGAPRPLTGVTAAPGLVHMSVSHDGAAVASWIEFRRGLGAVVAATSGTARRGFGRRYVLGTVTFDEPAQAAGGGDSAVVAWRTRHGGRPELRMAVAREGRFARGRRLTTNAPKSIVAAVDDRGEPTVAWREKVGPRHKVRAAFVTRGRPPVIDTLLERRAPDPPTWLWLAAAGRRSVLFVFAEGWTSGQWLDTAVRRSGRAFGAPEPLARGDFQDESAYGDLPWPDPRVLATPDGQIFAAWHRTRRQRACCSQVWWTEYARYEP